MLKLAAESPFQGEREAALAAAKRLAKKQGMSLEDAAADHTGREENLAEEAARTRANSEAQRNGPFRTALLFVSRLCRPMIAALFTSNWQKTARLELRAKAGDPIAM